MVAGFLLSVNLFFALLNSSTLVRALEVLCHLFYSWAVYLQVPLLFAHSFFRPLANTLTNISIAANCLFCLNTPFGNIWVLTTLSSLLADGFSYLAEKKGGGEGSTTTAMHESLWDMAAMTFSLNLCPQSFGSPPSIRKSEHSYFADVQVCHKRPMPRCQKPSNAYFSLITVLSYSYR